jgi:3-hydroxyisobutyrate dehydrogenase-like beta-hydroxyacid dehydrogenase
VRIYLTQAPTAVYDKAKADKGVPNSELSVQLISKLLEGVHLAAAAEAMAFAAKLGLDTQNLYDILRVAAGGSFMFENRVPAMLKADWTSGPTLGTTIGNLVR